MLHIIEKISSKYIEARGRQWKVEGMRGDATESIHKGDYIIIASVTEIECTYDDFIIAIVSEVEYFSDDDYTMIEYTELMLTEPQEARHPRLL